MCGIAGFCAPRTPERDAALQRSVAAMHHRGPDDSGVFRGRGVSLGAVRLKVIDLNGGHQPMHSDDGNTVVVVNGEIFNHQELRRELESLGQRFQTTCDTEVVLRAFLHWGAASFPKFRGMFAVAFWQQHEQRLTLVRDQMGVKPLYYHVKGTDLFFGSELKVLFAHEEIDRQIDLDALNCYLSLNYVPGPQTLVKGIRKLMPGCSLEWQGGRISIQEYKAKLPGIDPAVTLADAKIELDRLLQLSVSEQMVADVPWGIWASGGLDSSTLVHYAAQQSSKRLRTFSVTFKGRTFDESPHIRAISEHYGTDHSEFDLSSATNVVGAIEQMSYYSDEPSADAGALPVWFLSQMSRQHVTVALGGEGADELFGGYLTYQADRYAQLARLTPRFTRKAALSAAQWLGTSDDKISLEYKVKRFFQGSLLSREAAHVFWNGTFSEQEKRGFFLHAYTQPMAGLLANMASGPGIEPFLRFDQDYYLPDDILYKVDRMSMAHSLEVRPPFLDDRIVRFAATLPGHFKLKGSHSKIVLRELMKSKLPPSILSRSKMGFDIPVHDWFRTSLKSFLFDQVNQRSVDETGLFDWAGVEHILQQHLERRSNLGYHLWGLMTLLLWMKRWNITLGVSAVPSRSEAQSIMA
ncbi:MAG TPA: asparagine synthase (glutamine-hydrolyzing) [Terriglobales bacterium]|nr:asparagine synthase (glutamine-hydrolyzing) [Terriglobales bacterium]